MESAARKAYRKRYNDIHRVKRANQHRINRHRNAPPFVGIDGEGGTIDGRHEYLLLRAGEHVLETGQPLTATECLTWISNLPSDVIYVAYFFDYDVTMILRNLPAVTIRNLINREERTDKEGNVTPVYWNRFIIDYMPHKEFKVYKRGLQGKYSKPVVINDVGTFFQCSFVKALELWDIGNAPARKRILASKAKRDSFGTMTELTRKYNKLECVLLVELMTKFRGICGQVGPHPKKWQGPGDLASAWLRYHKIPAEQNVLYETMLFAREGYYGGRFEISAIGPIARSVHQYDINSAYPAVLPKLPCLVHGTWKLVNGHTRLSTNRVFVSRVHFYSPKSKLGCLPIRTKQGGIFYPQEGNGTYWSPELAAARRAGVKIDIQESWVYTSLCICNPFHFVEPVYQYRKQVGKTGKGYALKLVLNSLYGKFAQSIGHPIWANPIWAGLITAHTRAQIIDACRQVPADNILMIATDGIFTDATLNLPLSSKLGEWEHTQHKGMFIAQPGVYTIPDSHPKTRGVPMGVLREHEHRIRKCWVDTPGKPYPVELRRFMGIRLALALNKWDMAGQWYDESRAITFDWSTKRHETVGRWDGSAWRPGVKRGSADLISVPYDKDIGTWAEERSILEESESHLL